MIILFCLLSIIHPCCIDTLGSSWHSQSILPFMASSGYPARFVHGQIYRVGNVEPRLTSVYIRGKPRGGRRNDLREPPDPRS